MHKAWGAGLCPIYKYHSHGIRYTDMICSFYCIYDFPLWFARSESTIQDHWNSLKPCRDLKAPPSVSFTLTPKWCRRLLFLALSLRGCPFFFCRTCEWQILKCIHMHFSVHIFPHLIRLNSHLFVESSFYSSLVFRFPTIRYSHSHYAIAEWAANE